MRLRRLIRGLVPLVVLAGLVATPGQAAAAIRFPTATGQQAVSSTIPVSGTLDGRMQRYYGSGPLGTGGDEEDQSPLFRLADGAVLRNVILGSPAADGVHCAGRCTLQNVWWEDVGEDAATFRGSSSSISSLVEGGGARGASDKVFQHNGAGTLTIRNFQVENFGKLYRSCGNCGTQYRRNVVIDNVTATVPGGVLAGINPNYGDTMRIVRATIIGDGDRRVVPCQKYRGVTSGEPPKTGTGPDSTNCLYSPSSITYR